MVVMLAPAIALALYYLQAAQSGAQSASLQVRGNELAHYVESVELDLPRFMAISSRNALIALVKYEEDYNATVPDAPCVLSALSQYGNATNASCPGLALSANITLPTANSYLEYWKNRTITSGAKYGFSTGISLQNQSYNQSGPFGISNSVVLLLNASDKTGLMNFSIAKNISITAEISGLDDPEYLSNTQGLVRRNINFSQNISGAQNLSEFVNGKYYTASDYGASFLERLEGALWLSGKYGTGTGIETFAYVPQLEANGLPAKNQSGLDYEYFNASIAPGGCNAQELSCGEYWWLKLNATQAQKYGVTLNCTKCA